MAVSLAQIKSWLLGLSSIPYIKPVLFVTALAAAAAVIKLFVGGNLLLGFIAVGATFGFTVLVLAFAYLHEKTELLRGPAQLLMWATTVLFVLCATFSVSSTFLDWPKRPEDLLALAQEPPVVSTAYGPTTPEQKTEDIGIAHDPVMGIAAPARPNPTVFVVKPKLPQSSNMAPKFQTIAVLDADDEQRCSSFLWCFYLNGQGYFPVPDEGVTLSGGSDGALGYRVRLDVALTSCEDLALYRRNGENSDYGVCPREGAWEQQVGKEGVVQCLVRNDGLSASSCSGRQ